MLNTETQKRYKLGTRQVVNFTSRLQVLKLRQVCENQTYCKLIFADFLQVVESTCIKLVDKKSRQSTYIKPFDNLQQTCYHQAGASDANAF